MRILVTGHLGYIGTVMVPMLVDAGHEAVGLDSDIFRNCTFAEPLPSIPEMRKDVRDVTLADLGGFDAVVHLAALSNDSLSNVNPAATEEINLAATLRIARFAKQAGATRFLFASSCAIYGKMGDTPVDETAQIAPVTHYNVSKLRVEQEVGRLADDTFSPTFLRNATAYGVSPRMNCELVLNNLVAWAFTRGLVYIKSDGSPLRPIVHIEDISRAFLAVLAAPREVVHNQALNVGRNEDNYSIRELAEVVAQVVPGSRVEYAPDGKPDPRTYRVDFTKIHRLLPDFKPRWNCRTGVEQLHSAYRDRALSFEDFEGPRYRRIDEVRRLMAAGLLAHDFRWTSAAASALR